MDPRDDPGGRTLSPHRPAVGIIEYVKQGANAIGRIPSQSLSYLLLRIPRDLKEKLARLASLDWSRGNTKLWEDRAMSTGRLSKRSVNVILTGNAIKKHLGLPLSAEEEELAADFLRSRHG
jgi:DNA sulfur modification protein DndB